MEKMTRVHISIQPELWEDVGYVAKELHQSRSDVVRKLLRGRIDDYRKRVRYVNPADAQVIVGKLGQIYSELEGIRLEVHRIGVNLNQIARKLNTSGMLLSAEKAELSKNMTDLGPVLKQILAAKVEMEKSLWQFQE